MVSLMKQRFARKIFNCCPIDQTQPQGVMSGLAVLFLLLFSVLGLGLMTTNQIYMYLNSHRKNARLLNFAVENGIKRGFHRIINSASPLVPIGSKDFLSIRENALSGGDLACTFVFGETSGLSLAERWKNLLWDCTPDFILEDAEVEEEFFSSHYALFLESVGRLDAYPVSKRSRLHMQFGILAGRIPLSTVPLLLSAGLPPAERELINQSVQIFTSDASCLPVKPLYSDSVILPRSMSSLLCQALNIKMFTPEDLTLPQIRQAIGLVPSLDPIPEGVYLIEDDIGLGGIYIQGDVSCLTLASGNDFQILDFKTEAGEWVLRFSPEESTTIFSTPEETRYYDLIPRNMVIASGEIQSLCGGEVHPSGLSTIPSQEKIPCLLEGISLTVVSPRHINITSHLIHQGVEWKDGIPYLKGKKSQLHIFASGRDHQGEENVEWGEIKFGENIPDEIEIHASLTASGKGIFFPGTDTILKLYGSLHSKDLSVEGKIHIHPENLSVPPLDEWLDQPQTAIPVLYLTYLKSKAWIEE